jgi:hypothetical protein
MGKLHLLKQKEGGKYTAVISDDINSILETMNETITDKLEIVISSKEFNDVNKVLEIFNEKLSEYKTDDNFYEFDEKTIVLIKANFLRYAESN